MGNSLQEVWIPVNASNGMFDTEYSIGLILSDGAQVSFFADKDLVRIENERYFLRVIEINTYPELDKQLVLLPSETFETASRWAEVPIEAPI